MRRPVTNANFRFRRHSEGSICDNMADEELRPEFVDALRVLFDILDTSRTGRVSYKTICARFSELPNRNLPPTFLHCVARVAPQDGFLTFERFLAAVKLSFRDREINNNIPLQRVQSEGRLNQGFNQQKMQQSNMGMNGMNGFDRRSNVYASQPTLGQNRNSAYAQVGFAQPPRPPSYSEYASLQSLQDPSKVVLRQKKVNTVRSQKEESRMRHPLPPNGPRVQVVRSRPHSTTSYTSIASSGLENISWRNSSLSSAAGDDKRNTLHEADVAPRVAKLDSLHREEEEILKKGLDTNTRLQEWYQERIDSLEKRNRLLNKGMVTLDPSVHEQKLNFLRAHVTELNRRIAALMETSEKGFPTHENLQKISNGNPADDQIQWLHRQNRMLNQELGDKTRQIEELKRENENSHVVRIQPTRPLSMHQRPSAFVRPALQAPQPNIIRHSASPVKIYDTLM